MNYSEMDDKIFEFVYVSAMRDATLQKSFPVKKGCKKDWMTNCRKFPDSTEMLKAFVKDVIEGKFSDSDSTAEKIQKKYDERFLKVSIELCKEINSKIDEINSKIEGYGRFTFGNAQKLINILMKYFYLHSFGNEEEKANFRFCHCPMDHQLLENVWKSLTKDTRKSLDTRRGDFLSSWGNKDFSNNDEFPKRYKAFQKAVKELAKAKGISSLEYDYSVWGNAGTDS